MAKKKLKPGTIIQSGMAVVDARRRIRTLPKDPAGRERVLAGIKRVVRAKKPEKIKLPPTIPRRTLVKVLEVMGYAAKRGTGGAEIYHHKRGAPIKVPRGSGGDVMGLKRSQYSEIIRRYLEGGGKL